ncbi:hypothetical protein OF83DRAFT_615227 [Amylostereum chailletii]|nr:hypothetical protein OF83DRAFT_615227 [Amylostereum chailletii]
MVCALALGSAISVVFPSYINPLHLLRPRFPHLSPFHHAFLPRRPPPRLRRPPRQRCPRRRAHVERPRRRRLEAHRSRRPHVERPRRRRLETFLRPRRTCMGTEQRRVETRSGRPLMGPRQRRVETRPKSRLISPPSPSRVSAIPYPAARLPATRPSPSRTPTPPPSPSHTPRFHSQFSRRTNTPSAPRISPRTLHSALPLSHRRCFVSPLWVRSWPPSLHSSLSLSLWSLWSPPSPFPCVLSLSRLRFGKGGTDVVVISL